jgi:glycine cleavage system H protein
MVEYRGCELPEDLYYDLDYLWARPNDDGTYTIGLTDPAQTMGCRIVAATFRKRGKVYKAGHSVATLESGKWVGGVPAPFDGTIERTNPVLESNPGLINVSPYGEAWVVVMRPTDPETARQRLHTGPEATAALKAWIDRYNIECMRCAE